MLTIYDSDPWFTRCIMWVVLHIGLIGRPQRFRSAVQSGILYRSPIPLCQEANQIRIRSQPHQSSTNTRASVFVDCPTLIAWPLRGPPPVVTLPTTHTYHVVLIRATTTPNLWDLNAKNSVGLLAPACRDRYSRNSRPRSMGMERETR